MKTIFLPLEGKQIEMPEKFKPDDTFLARHRAVPEYFNAASPLRRGQWQPQWTGKALVNYVRGGFGVPALP